jgi:ADP-ribosylglycohydrolase
MEHGRHWFSSGDPYSKGCGAAMRSAPIGLVYSTDPDRLVEVARAVAICTHGHPTALASSITASAAVAYVVREAPIQEMVSYLLKTLNSERGVPGYIECVSHDPLQEQTKLLGMLDSVLAIEPEFAFDHIGGGWIGEETVAGALYCFLRSPEDFRQTVLVAANASRSDFHRRDKGRCDSDSIACVAGAISGAHNGVQGIPPEWIEGIENRDGLMDIGKKLAAKAAQPRSLLTPSTPSQWNP